MRLVINKAVVRQQYKEDCRQRYRSYQEELRRIGFSGLLYPDQETDKIYRKDSDTGKSYRLSAVSLDPREKIDENKKQDCEQSGQRKHFAGKTSDPEFWCKAFHFKRIT